MSLMSVPIKVISMLCFIAFKYSASLHSNIHEYRRRQDACHPLFRKFCALEPIIHCRQTINYKYLYTCHCVDSPDYSAGFVVYFQMYKTLLHSSLYNVLPALRTSIFLGSRTHRNAMKRGSEICQL